MKKPGRIVEMLDAMIDNGVRIPVSIKCRVGVDDFDSYEFLHGFVRSSMLARLLVTFCLSYFSLSCKGERPPHLSFSSNPPHPPCPQMLAPWPFPSRKSHHSTSPTFTRLPSRTRLP